MNQSTTAAVARQYADALSAKDFAALGRLFADDIVWHQPGGNRFSGTLRGSAAVNELIGGQMALTQGTFELGLTGDPMVNGAMFTIPVHFGGKRDGAELSMAGVDVLRVDGDRIAEVWLFSADQEAEDDFWGAA